jgi:hypothetical protein
VVTARERVLCGRCWEPAEPRTIDVSTFGHPNAVLTVAHVCINTGPGATIVGRSRPQSTRGLTAADQEWLAGQRRLIAEWARVELRFQLAAREVL